MKSFLILLAFTVTNLKAQTVLKFDKRFVESEDKWVAFQMKEDSTYAYGFIYIDESAGLTLNYEGYFKIDQTGVFLPKKLDNSSLKVRLEPNKVLVAFIPDSKFKELNISAIPEWLEIYKTDTNSIARLYRWGFIYNGYEECAKALTYLEKAEKINPKYEGLAVELAFSYNCLKQYDKAELILEAEIIANSSDAYVNKEYIYTLSKNNKIDKAVNQFEKSIKTLKDKQYNAENCFNILQYYFAHNDKDNFNKFYRILQSQPNENNMLTRYADQMKIEISK